MAIYQTADVGPVYGEYGADLNVNADMNTGYTTSRSYAPSEWQCDENNCAGGGLAGSHHDWTITELETFAVRSCATKSPTNAPTSASTPLPAPAPVEINSGSTIVLTPMAIAWTALGSCAVYAMQTSLAL
jgi:hypothetical protein